jgi:hypothetical protein
VSGSLSTLTPEQQIEAIYVAYFGRAADGGGYSYWVRQYTSDYATYIAAGDTSAQAEAATVQSISESFSVQAEAQANYAFLATPPAIPVPDPLHPGSFITAQIDAFLSAVYLDLFARPIDSAGEAYWSAAILSGPTEKNPLDPHGNHGVTVGAAIYDIANGAAVGSVDANTLANKVEAGLYFTNLTTGANIGVSQPYVSTLGAAAVASVAPVTSDAATVTASKAATYEYVYPTQTVAPPTPIYLTLNIDNLTGGPGGDLFVANAVNNGNTLGLQNQLQSGDELTGGAITGAEVNVLQATLTADYFGIPDFIANLDPSAPTYVYFNNIYEYFHSTNPTYVGYYVRPILNNIQTLNIVNSQEPSGYYFEVTFDLTQSQNGPTSAQDVTNVSVQGSPFGDYTFVNAAQLLNVTLGGPSQSQGSPDSTLYLLPNGGPAFADPQNLNLQVTTASIINSDSGGIVFGFRTGGVGGTQYGEDVPLLTLNVTNSPSAFYNIYGYTFDENLGGVPTIDLNLTSSTTSTVLPRPGAVGPQLYQTQLDPDHLTLYDHALNQFGTPILTDLNIDVTGNYEVFLPENTYSFSESSSVTDRNTFLDVHALTIKGGPAQAAGTPTANPGFGSLGGALDLTGDTFGSSNQQGGLYGAVHNQDGNNQDGFQHFRQLVSLDASTYAGNLDINIGSDDWSQGGIFGGVGATNNLASIALGSGDNHLDLITEYSAIHYTVTTGNGNNVVLFGYDNLTNTVTVTGGTGNNTLGLTNGDLLNSDNTVNVTGFDTLEFVGAAYKLVSANFAASVNDYNLGALPGGSVNGSTQFSAVTLTAYYNPGFAQDIAGTSSSGTTDNYNGGYFGASENFPGTFPGLPVGGDDALQSTGQNADGTQASASVFGDLLHTSTDYVIGGNVVLWNAPTNLPLTITNYADDSHAHRLSTGDNGIFVFLSSLVYGNQGAVTSKTFWQYVNLLQLDFSSAFFGDEGHNYATLNIDDQTTLPAGSAKATAYVDEINHLGDYGVSTIAVTGNATLWIDDLTQTNPLLTLDGHTSTGNLGSNWEANSGVGGGVTSSAHLGYLDVNAKFIDGPPLLIETTQGLNFLKVDGINRSDVFDLLGGNNQIVVDNDHIGLTGNGDQFNFYAPGTNSLLPGFQNTIPHIHAGNGNGAIDVANAEIVTGDPLHPNLNVATIYGFQSQSADNPITHLGADVIELNGFNFAVGAQQILNITPLAKIGDTTDLTSVAGLFTNGANQYAVADYVVQNGYSSIAHPRDVFVFVDVNHDGNFTAATDLVVQLINTAHDISLTAANNFHFA